MIIFGSRVTNVVSGRVYLLIVLRVFNCVLLIYRPSYSAFQVCAWLSCSLQLTSETEEK